MPTDKLLELEGLTKYFYKPMGLLGRRKQVVQSVDHVSLHILRHETFGLVGESGCGKSTLGRKLARRLGVDFIDTDALVEEREGASVADVFRYEGEERFREAERRVLDEVIAGASFAVVSTGGGLPTWRDNMPCMNAVGHTVYLRRSPEQIARRLSPYGRRKRPRLQGLDDEQLVAFMRGDMAAREPFYAQASLVVDCDPMSDDELVEHIVQTFSDRG